MSRFKVIMAVAVLAASMFLLVDKLFAPQPIQIILETGQEVATQGSSYFALSEVLLLIVTSFLIGTTSTYLFFNSEADRLLSVFKKPGEPENKYDLVIPLLKGDEQKVFLELRNSGGEVLQNALVLKLGFSKVKVTRILSSLEGKNLVVKERYGLTNRIRLR
jgi:uncharacterized membrane protein